MRNYQDKREFIIGRIIAEDEAGRTFASNPKSTRQTSPGAGRAIFDFHRVELGKTPDRAFVAVPKKVCVYLQIENCSSQSSPLSEGKLGKFRDDLGSAHKQNLRQSGVYFKRSLFYKC